jgi:CBS domain-containing protein
MIRVEHILEDARRRLVVVGRDTPLRAAAAILSNSNTPLVVVCDPGSVALGVLSSRDILIAFSRATRDATAETCMTRAIYSCGTSEPLQSLWTSMGNRNLRSVPILDAAGRPMGIAHARDVARALMDEITQEELLLRDYVLGVGYR